MKGIYAKLEPAEEQKVNILKAVWKFPRKDETLRRIIREFPMENYVQTPQSKDDVNETLIDDEDEVIEDSEDKL